MYSFKTLMTYLSDKRRKRTYWNIGLGLILFFLFVYFWPQFKAVSYPVVQPLVRWYGNTKVFASIVPSFITTYVTTHRELFARNVALEKEIERLENTVAEKDAMFRELALTVEGGNADSPTSVVVLYPLMEDKTKLYSTTVLSKGYKDGIEKGALVYVRGMQIACEIVEVYDKTSLCELISRGGRSTEGVTGTSTLTLSLIGVGGGDYVADLPKGTQVREGEKVYLRSNQAYVMGTIVRVTDDEQATGIRVYVRGAYNPAASSVFYINTPHAD